MNRRILLFALLICIGCNSYANRDSLITVIKSKSSIETRLPAYSELAFDIYLSNPDSGILVAQQGFDYALKSNNKFQQANNMNALGLSYFRKGWYAKSIEAFNKSIELFDQKSEQEQIARVYLNIGHVFQAQKDYHSAHAFNLKAIKQFEVLNDSFRIACSYQTLCVISRELKDYSQSSAYINRSIQILSKLDEPIILANSYTTKGNLLSVQKKYLEAIQAFKQAIFLLDKTGDLSNKAIAYENLGLAYEELGNYSIAINYFNQAFDLFGIIKSDVDQAYERMKRSIALAKTGNFQAANNDIDSAEIVFKSENLPDYLQELYLYKCDVLEIQGKPAEALSAYRKHTALKDSLENVRRVDELMRLQKEFESEQKEKQIALLQSGSEVQSTQLSRRNWVILALFILGAAGIIILIILRNRRILKDELAKQQLLNRIASDLHDDVGATLSSIRMYGDVLKTKAIKLAPELAPMADKISSNAQEMIHTMSDIVWTIKPGQERFSDLQDRIWNAGIELCAPKNIQFAFSGKEGSPDFVMNTELRHDIYMICKEAMNNAVKYSNCSELNVRLMKLENYLELIISDNGIGFDEKTTKRGNGLNNMEMRCLEHSAILEINSKIGIGTTIRIQFPI